MVLSYIYVHHAKPYLHLIIHVRWFLHHKHMAKPMKTFDLHYPMIQLLRT